MYLVRPLAATALLLGFVHAATAAEPLIASWSGWYVGLAGGAGFGSAQQTDVSAFGAFDAGRYGTSGPVMGATAGFNWQTGSLVLGAETDFSFAHIHGSTNGIGGPLGTCIQRCQSTIEALGTLRARLGVAYGSWMPYLTGGLAYARLHGQEGPFFGFGGNGSKYVTGYTVGGGAELQLAPRWTAKFEYLYVDLGKHGVWTNTLPPPAFTAVENLDVSAHIVRAGLNYHF